MIDAKTKAVRKLLFTPLKTKDALKDWITFFLKVDLPDCIVMDEGPNPSNSSPMDVVWDIYNQAIWHQNPDISRIMAYSSRDSFKSLSAMILQVLSVFHMERSSGVMASTFDQVKNISQYLKDFLILPYLIDFSGKDNERKVSIVKYYNEKDETYLNEKEYNQISEAEKPSFKRTEFSVQVIMNSMAGANSLHVPNFCCDELDTMQDPRAYYQAVLGVPTVKDGKFPITLLTSTRKSGVGLVQKELDEAEKTGLVVKHWGLIDVTEACPSSRHLPEEPMVKGYISDELLKAVNQEDYDLLPVEEQIKYDSRDVYQGCFSKCKMLFACKTKLATHQKSTSPLLKPIDMIQQKFRQSNEEFVKAELLTWRPSSEGMIYSRLDPKIHFLNADEIFEKLTGINRENTTKDDIYRICRSKGFSFYGGIDWGYTHQFVVTIGVKLDNSMFILDCHAMGELDDVQKVEFCNRTIKHLSPTIYADPESPQSIKLFRRSGFKMKEWSKGPGSVLTGIQIVRTKLWPLNKPPELYFLSGDDGVASLFKELQKYHWKTDKAGKLLDEPVKEEDDAADSFRYLIQNVFQADGKRILTASTDPEDPENVFDPDDANKNPTKVSAEGILRDEIEKRVLEVPASGRIGKYRWET